MWAFKNWTSAVQLQQPARDQSHIVYSRGLCLYLLAACLAVTVYRWHWEHFGIVVVLHKICFNKFKEMLKFHHQTTFWLEQELSAVSKSHTSIYSFYWVELVSFPQCCCCKSSPTGMFGMTYSGSLSLLLSFGSNYKQLFFIPSSCTLHTATVAFWSRQNIKKTKKTKNMWATAGRLPGQFHLWSSIDRNEILCCILQIPLLIGFLDCSQNLCKCAWMVDHNYSANSEASSCWQPWPTLRNPSSRPRVSICHQFLCAYTQGIGLWMRCCRLFFF